MGFASSNVGSSYIQISTQGAGRAVATLVKPDAFWHYAEAWDQTVEAQSVGPLIRYRRE